MVSKNDLRDELSRTKEEKLEQWYKTEAAVADWMKTLRSIKETLNNPLATDWEMETVRQAVDGLIATHLAFYRDMMKY
jgi:hypothetical protein